MLVAFIIAAALIVYFAVFAGKDSGFHEAESQFEISVNEDSEVVASLREKFTAPGRSLRATNWAVFACDDGVAREFMLQKEIFDELYIGQRDTLIYNGAVFLGFGPYGGTEISDDEAADILNAPDFSNDDFDESIDIEQRIDLTDKDGEDALNAEDKEAFERFLAYDKLQSKSELITDEPDSLFKYKTERLLQKLTVYPFLKREDKVVRMFERTYDDAIEDMRGYDGDSRRGMAADDLILNGNEIRLVVTVQEAPPPLRCTVTAEFGVND